MTRGWRQKLQEFVRPVRPVYVQGVAPVEVPVITETRRRIGRGDYTGAIRYAFPSALRDAERAYGLHFPPELTNGEILAGGFPAERAEVAELFGQLYRLYEPARYGDARTTDPETFLGLLKSIYADRPMWSLYIELVAGPSPGGAKKRAMARQPPGAPVS